MNKIKLLENIGLTNSEIKVYLSLLKLGTSKKHELVKEARIASSKIYEITEKLKQKGLLSEIKINNVKYFSAANPNSILDHVQNIKKDIDLKEKKIKENIVEFEKLINKTQKESQTQMFFGWRGLKTLYLEILNSLEKNDENYVVGATQGENKEKTERFYSFVNKKLKQKEIKLNILFGKGHKEYAEKIKNKGGLNYTKAKYLPFSFPTELNIFKDSVAIIILTEEPLAILIKNEHFAKSSKAYFEALWEIAEN